MNRGAAGNMPNNRRNNAGAPAAAQNNGFLGNVSNLANNAFTGVKSAATGAANAVGNAFNGAVNGATKLFNNAANGAGEVVNNAVKNTNAAFNADAAAAAAPTANNNKKNGAFFGIPAAANKMTNVAENVAENAGNAVSNFLGFNNNSKKNNRGNGNGNGNRNNTNANALENAANTLLNAANNTLNVGEEGPGFLGSIWLWLLIIILLAVGVIAFFYNEIVELLPPNMQDALDRFKQALGIAPAPAPVPEPVAASASAIDVSGDTVPPAAPGLVSTGLSSIAGNLSGIIEKQLPPQKKEVFNIKENRYTYDDAEPLCKALGAELATYDQVREAYEQGADWCNYGWVKGQRAIYPTQESTYEKLQQGPKEQRMACGKPGVNGGYFDNPELRFGVTCYGVKPVQKAHDTTLLPNGEANPFTPDALEFDKRVAEFKADSANIGILPFKEGDWTGADN